MPFHLIQIIEQYEKTKPILPPNAETTESKEPPATTLLRKNSSDLHLNADLPSSEEGATFAGAPAGNTGCDSLSQVSEESAYEEDDYEGGPAREPDLPKFNVKKYC